LKGESIRITGTVQGVGFRPTVWRLAQECHIRGQVWNDAEGVLIQAWGDSQSLTVFVQRLQRELPPLARLEDIIRTVLPEDVAAPGDFQIVPSQTGSVHTRVAADAASCPQCLAEVTDPHDRRHRYPFANCTHCGPRLSIIKAIPYDRAQTSMAVFPLCARCQAEYDDPGNRRFHAQPNACTDCGPQVWLENAEGERWQGTAAEDSVARAARLLKDGRIVAIKGIGGIHLACDASNEQAVKRLRQRKQRYRKAFALMAADIAMVRRFAAVSKAEASLLQHRAAPIVVLDAGGEGLAAALNPGQNTLGFMLPYTPLHALLMQDMTDPIVLTSGNRSDEPQAISNQEARSRLRNIADYFLLHDRDIVNRQDDSVQYLVDGVPRFFRRARGYAPQPIGLAEGFAKAGNILGMGSELKNCIGLLRSGSAILSQHLGNLENSVTFRQYQQTLGLYRRLFAFTADLIVVDKHPDYLSTALGRSLAGQDAVPLLEVQHHHAHIASCMAEHGLPLDTGKVLGVALDGLGFGDDQSLWGGEFLLVNYVSCRRLAHFQQVAMPGGAKAMQEPWRNTYAQLVSSLGWGKVAAQYPALELVQFLESNPLKIMQTMIDRGLNSPMTSSAGRLFDAVAAAVGVCRDTVSHEGQAAIELEALATPHFATQQQHAYACRMVADTLDWTPMWSALLQDLAADIEPGVIAARFHQGIAKAVTVMASQLCDLHRLGTVVLSGGVFQNRLLLQQTSRLLREQNLLVLTQQQVPMNDGGLALGQVAIGAASRLSRV